MYNKNKEGSHVHKARVSERGREGGAGEKGRGEEYERKGERERERERERWGVGGKREFKVSIN